jgi:hypothetical protein
MRMVCCKECAEGLLNEGRSVVLFCHFGQHVGLYIYFDSDGNWMRISAAGVYGVASKLIDSSAVISSLSLMQVLRLFGGFILTPNGGRSCWIRGSVEKMSENDDRDRRKCTEFALIG